MQSLKVRRRITLVAIMAMLFVTTVFVAHGFGGSVGPNHEAQCKLCQQFGGTAAPQAAPTLVVLSSIIVLRAVLPVVQPIPVRRVIDSRLPRGPPIH